MSRPPGGDVTIRDASAADLPAITAIYAHHVLHGLASFEETPPEASEMARRMADVQGRGLPYLVAVQGGAVLGFAYAAPYRARPAYRFAVEDSVYIQPGATGRGLGRAALGEIVRRCTDAGLRQMIAIIGDSGNAPSIGLHEALGFRHVGTLQSVGFKHGRWVDTVIMQLDLGPGDRVAPDS
jgi:phosphinothricin acetyltransferase